MSVQAPLAALVAIYVSADRELAKPSQIPDQSAPAPRMRLLRARCTNATKRGARGVQLGSKATAVSTWNALASAFPEYQKRGVTPVTVSVDKPDAEAKTKATYAIPFPVLSDSDATMIEAFHVVNKVDDQTLAKMKGFGVDLESYSGKTHHEIAIPSLFLIDRTGVVRWAHSDPDIKVRPSTAQILAAIDAARLASK